MKRHRVLFLKTNLVKFLLNVYSPHRKGCIHDEFIVTDCVYVSSAVYMHYSCLYSTGIIMVIIIKKIESLDDGQVTENICFILYTHRSFLKHHCYLVFISNKWLENNAVYLITI